MLGETEDAALLSEGGAGHGAVYTVCNVVSISSSSSGRRAVGDELRQCGSPVGGSSERGSRCRSAVRVVIPIAIHARVAIVDAR